MTIPRSAFLLASLLALGQTPAFAQLPILPECDMRQMSMVEVGQCLDKKYTEADAELNRVYQAVLKALEPAQQVALRKAQRGWIAQRGSDVALIYTLTGGNHPSIMARPTEILLVRQRIAFLKALIGQS